MEFLRSFFFFWIVTRLSATAMVLKLSVLLVIPQGNTALKKVLVVRQADV